MYSLFGQKLTKKRIDGKYLWITRDDEVIAEGFMIAHLQARRGARTPGEVLSKLKQVYPRVKVALEITKFFPEAFQKEGLPARESWKKLLQTEIEKLDEIEEKSQREDESVRSSESESEKSCGSSERSVEGKIAKEVTHRVVKAKNTTVTVNLPKGVSVSISVKED